MLFYKKILKSIELIDAMPFCDKIDNFNKAIVPAKYLKKKKDK
jgi:hypothetical protein